MPVAPPAFAAGIEGMAMASRQIRPKSPFLATACGIKRKNFAGTGAIKGAIHYDRGVFKLTIGPQVIAPNFAQVADVTGIDLGEAGIVHAAGIAIVIAIVAILSPSQR